MKVYLGVLLYIALFLTVSCAGGSGNQVTMQIVSDKIIYEEGEPFNLSIAIDTKDEIFVPIIIDSYREGFDEHLLVGFCEQIGVNGLNTSYDHAGYPLNKAFLIDERQSKYGLEAFQEKGIYHIDVSVYDGEDLMPMNYSCPQESMGHPLLPSDAVQFLYTKVVPIATVQKQVKVTDEII